MKFNNSIWLLPNPKYEMVLNLLIKKATNYLSYSKFDAHCTLVGGVNEPSAKLIELIESLTFKSNSISCDSIGITLGKPPWKSYYINIKLNPDLVRTQNYFSERILDVENFFFEPHISLVYGGGLDEKDLRNLIKISNIPTKIIFNRIALVDTSNSVRNWTALYKTNIGQN